MDIRERKKPWWLVEDRSRMELHIQRRDADLRDVTLSAVYEVCSVCSGKGSHVNPSIDSQGLSYEDLYSDPDFAEDYFRGAYDVQCNECGGDKVVLTVDRDRCSEEDLQEWDEAWEFEYTYAAEIEAERQMGA